MWKAMLVLLFSGMSKRDATGVGLGSRRKKIRAANPRQEKLSRRDRNAVLGEGNRNTKGTSLRRRRPEATSQHAEDGQAEWEQYRKSVPVLQLRPVQGDELTWLLAGRPDAVVSLAYWEMCRAKFSEGDAMGAVQHLLELMDRYPFTGMHSGWVTTLLGQIVLEDERASRRFMTSYWARTRRALARSTMAAFEALELVRGEHRQHWLAATNWMLRFLKRKHNSREGVTQFVDRALKEYRDRADAVQHTCLKEDGLRALAMAVLTHSHLRATELCDHALAGLYDTSRSTLSHLRGSINKRFGRTRR